MKATGITGTKVPLWNKSSDTQT